MSTLEEKILQLEACVEDLMKAIKKSKIRLLDEEEAADYLGIKPSTLRTYRNQGKSAKYIKEEGLGVKYDIKDLDAYIEGLPRKGGGII